MAINCKAYSFHIFATFALILAVITPAAHGHGNDAFAPASTPTSDGTAIDQGIAYCLMLLALVLTYIIHIFDAPFN